MGHAESTGMLQSRLVLFSEVHFYSGAIEIERLASRGAGNGVERKKTDLSRRRKGLMRRLKSDGFAASLHSGGSVVKGY